MEEFDIDSILADEEKVKVKFNCKIDNFGFYISPTTKYIREGYPVDLPFFLVHLLLKNDHCELVDNTFSQLKDDLFAHAPMVNLQNSHFYEINCKFEDAKQLSSIFYERIGEFVKSINKEDFSEDDVSKMSYCERKYFIESRKNFKAFQDFYLKKSNE